MAKTGNDEELGTAEGAAMSRALHAKHAVDPILQDDWAVELLTEENRSRVHASTSEASLQVTPGFDASPIFAIGVACLRYAEDEVERCVARGIDQYLVLGAGFDTFALRKGNLSAGLRVFEVDHPDVQALKRQRIAASSREPARMPHFVPVDFETSSLLPQVGESAFDASRPAVLSWMNTIPYLSEAATTATLRELHSLLAAGSRIVFNYGADVPLTPDQLAFLSSLARVIEGKGEPTRSRWNPERFEALLADIGFEVVEHATEQDLTKRYFEGRPDGMKPGVPGRVITADRP
jgi:methyltransferase (TIGR00027 family)